MTYSDESAGALLDAIQKLKLKRDLTVEVYDDQIKTLSSQLETMLKSAHKKDFKTEIATAYWQNSTTAVVEDWNAVMQYVKENDAFDILQKRISPAQLKARLEAGAVIAGASVKTEALFIVKGKKQ